MNGIILYYNVSGVLSMVVQKNPPASSIWNCEIILFF